ncbi:MAG: hypothetical protein OZ914_09405 [Anaerolineaceae bacterium]|nr:hypothetical protein [Anaerolineaceae bacterium]
MFKIRSHCQKICIVSLFLALSTACSFSSATPTPQPLADSAFSGYAFIDSNFNGQLDAEDAPLEGAMFSVEINGVKAFGAITDKNGYAFILIPSSVDFPVTLSMEAPKESNLDYAGFSEVIVHSLTEEPPKFLFIAK